MRLVIIRAHHCFAFFLNCLGAGSDVVPLPINFQRLIWNAKTIFHISDKEPSNLHPAMIVTQVMDV